MIPNILGRLNPRMPRDNWSSWLMGMGFCLVAFNSVVTVLVSDADITQQAPLHVVNILILILMRRLCAFGQGTPNAAARFLVWFLSTLIMAILTWSMTKEAPVLLMKMITWFFVVVVSLLAFYFVFFPLQIGRGRSIRHMNACLCFCLILVFFNSPMANGTTNIADRVNSVIFDFFSWLAFMIESGCITGMVITHENSAVREWMKFGSWAFGTMLAAMFSVKVAEYFPWLMKYVTWAMVVASSISTLYAFFFQGEAYLDDGNV